MNIRVEYKDSAGTITNKTHRLTRLSFAKHLAIAGQGYAPRPQKLIRTLAMFFHYSSYIQRQAFYNDRFSEPPIQLSDPTEKGQFSNLAGKAIADFLAKRIDNALFTVNYEAAMKKKGLSIKGSRPDLLAFNNNATFAIEAKGYSDGHGNMTTHKTQSQTGRIPVNFSVACVSYHLYNNFQCKYHDPYNDNVPYDNELLKKLTRQYYSGLAEFLNEKYFNYREIEIQGEKFYEVELSYKLFEKLFPEEFPFRHFWHFEILEYYRPRIILPTAIRDYAENGITNDIKPFIFDINKEQEKNLYIDNDRIGLQIRG
ncbi:hypothetical protein MROS_0905 [Melioribacter roseus P3M-2]|uniref:Uncharacterized protein n=1 Tax=Melioribacter roseus (strain DSM 23840 / JCM 17771 / VKM B-2668 / P3M-2) TaxID=1191523 RepID=I7A2I8_MELRP|nr:hypothetical protein [Melioribacter roseus]AFN74146.1 hypothetical protein MROS_0905 [Melioribacter roseus P3M-2]